jgi:hypothetical protein
LQPSPNIRRSARSTLAILQEFGTPFEGGSTRDIRIELPSKAAPPDDTTPGYKARRVPGIVWLLGLVFVASSL